MAFEERKYLDTVEFCLTQKTINVKWIEEVLKNGVVISSNPHRGAYPLNEDGEPDDEVQTLIGSTLKDILGQAGDDAQKRVDDLTTQLRERDLTIQEYANTINEQNKQLSLANEYRAQSIVDTHELNQELSTRQTTIDNLNQRINEYKEQVSGLSTQLSDAHQEIRNLEAGVEELKVQRDNATTDWEASQDELVSVRAELDEANKSVEVLKTELDGIAKAQVDKNAGTE